MRPYPVHHPNGAKTGLSSVPAKRPCSDGSVCTVATIPQRNRYNQIRYNRHNLYTLFFPYPLVCQQMIHSTTRVYPTTIYPTRTRTSRSAHQKTHSPGSTIRPVTRGYQNVKPGPPHLPLPVESRRVSHNSKTPAGNLPNLFSTNHFLRNLYPLTNS